MTTQPSRPRKGQQPVTVRSMSTPKPGWTLADAVGLAEQGYSLEQIEKMTGFVKAHVAGQLKPAKTPRD